MQPHAEFQAATVPQTNSQPQDDRRQATATAAATDPVANQNVTEREEEVEEVEEEESPEEEEEEEQRDLAHDGNSVVGVSIGPMQRQMSSNRTTTLEKARALQQSSQRIPQLKQDFSSNQNSLRDKRDAVPPRLDAAHTGRSRADSESGLKKYLPRLNLPSLPNATGLQRFIDRLHPADGEANGTFTDHGRHQTPEQTASPDDIPPPALPARIQTEQAPEKPARPQALRRRTSDGTLLYRAQSRASSLGDDTRWADVHEQVNVRFKAIKDSFADSAAGSIKMPRLLPDISALSLGHLGLPGSKSKDSSKDPSPRASTTNVASKGKVQTPDGHLMSPPAGMPKERAATHPHFAKAVKHLEGDVVILGGYRGSILRQAEPPHRQCWVPIKVGLNMRKVNLEVGLDEQADERMPETIIPGGMLSHIGPVDISRRLFKRLRASSNAKRGVLRVWDYGYDWRLNPLLLSRQLVEYLEALPCNRPGTPVERRGATVIAHSLGGLITRHAVNQRPELFAGVVYAGVPQHCVNVLGPLRNGDDVLLSSKVLTAQVNFTIRTSFALLPLDGYCFVDRDTGDEHRVDFFDPRTWDEHRLSPVVARPLPALAASSPPGSGGAMSNLRGSISSVLPSITQRRNSSPKPASSGNQHSPGGSSTPVASADQQQYRAQPNAPQMDAGMPPPPPSNADEAGPRTAVTLPRAAALAYLERTLRDVKRFKQELAWRERLEAAGAYPPAAVIYGKSIPTVCAAQVRGREGIGRADAYDDLAFASGDGVVLARAAQLPDGYTSARGGVVSSERGHISLLGDLEAVGRCVGSVVAARRDRLRQGLVGGMHD